MKLKKSDFLFYVICAIGLFFGVFCVLFGFQIKYHQDLEQFAQIDKYGFYSHNTIILLDNYRLYEMYNVLSVISFLIAFSCIAYLLFSLLKMYKFKRNSHEN